MSTTNSNNIENNAKSETMMAATANLFNQPFLADIQFIIDEEIIYAHSHELSKRSSVFAEQYRNTIGTMTLVPVLNYSYTEFYEFLYYIYTDECIVSQENALSLLKLSMKYKIISLTTLIRGYLIKNLAIGNVLEYFEFCLLENYTAPMEDLTNFITENFLVIIKQNRNFLKINLQTLIALLKFDKIDNKTTETDVYNAMLKWVKNYCIKNSLQQTGKSKRKVLTDAVNFIRFPVMKSEEFSLCIENDKDLLTTEEINSIFVSISLQKKQNSFGFAAIPRTIGINYATISDLKLNMRPYVGLIGLEKQTPWSTNVVTTFTTNQIIIFTGIEIGVSELPQNIRVELQNGSCQILREVRFDFTNQQSLAWKKGWIAIDFLLPFLLKPCTTYKLHLKYLKPTCEAYGLPNKKLRHAVTKSCAIQFDKTIPFLLQMNFKQSK